ncbi:penicillin acylase family protein [Paucibacter sp. R3-3]|uniref:Penicillin acylase family protein n=1 Tax=Roseateles agri TaxID=3098619 RepID=A0ABU5DK40_9BURK|nr:penicillin acylase family protein [Paucibacter sp. R3-3]MDY0746666.1 penicillin acylase family protein [Paucibacter sp. R3-3]
MILLRRLLLGLLVLVLLLAIALYLGLRGSLPTYDGQLKSGVSAPVKVERDERGYATITAGNRVDAARALGFTHAQERFFQMDLLRRNAAGELSALVGAKALPLDKSRRINRFRHRAELALAASSPEEQKLLLAYAEGVNEGLAQLSVRPFEYGLLRQAPKPWRPEDSLLAVLSMYLDLQGAQGRDELAMGALKDAVPAEWYAFFTQLGGDWQQAVDGSVIEPVAIPKTPWPEALKPAEAAAKVACSDCSLQDSRDIGSNNFVVAGALTPHGGAIVADDMHLGTRLPGIWFKARLVWTDELGKRRQVTGLSLPGTPAITAGSNGSIAWGFTNSTADWTDVIALKLDATGTRYMTPEGEKPLTVAKEHIEVAGGEAVDMEVKETIWGPVMAAPFDHYALRWVAFDTAALNLKSVALERAASADEALTLAVGVGIPAQNLVVGDAKGHIGWTIIGAIPKRHYADGVDMNVPQDWSTGANGWNGYMSADDHPPRIDDPADGRLWSANARQVGGEALALLGTGGYDLGARGQQIRNDLRALPKLDETAVHGVQLDYRAVFLQRWRKLLLDEVLTPDFIAKNGLAEYRDAVDKSADEARPDAVGYALVRQFRDDVLEELFAPMAALMEKHQLKMRDLKVVPETAGWMLIQAGRADAVSGGNWHALFERAVLKSRDQAIQRAGSVTAYTWGSQNKLAFAHPLSAAVPGLAALLDMPATPMFGDRHMPRVALPGHGQSERMVVSPGHEDKGILTIPAGQSGHPLSPFYKADHEYWLEAKPLPFLPGDTRHTLMLEP